MAFTTLRKLLLLPVLAGILASCAYSKVKLPYDRNVDETRLGSKIGEASFHQVLWLFAWGDASTRAAAENGEIEVIRHLDREQFLILFGVYGKQTTIAYGD